MRRAEPRKIEFGAGDATESSMRFERTWYEVNPYVYAAMGAATIVYPPGSLLMKASGFVLLFAALTILGLRWIYRRDVDRAQELDESAYVGLVTQDLFFDAYPGNRRSR